MFIQGFVKSRLVAALAGGLLVAVGGGIAFASVPDGGGLIHACYNANAAEQANGATLHIIDSDATSCSSGATEISWPQSAPPPVPPVVTTYNYRVGGIVAGTSVARAFCQPGEAVTGGGGLATSPADVGLMQDFPISDATGVGAFGTTAIGWQVAGEGFGGVQAYVICASTTTP